MKIFLLISLIIAAALSTVSAQEKATINGRVSDNKGLPIDAAAVSLHHVKDSALAATGLTGEKGNYLLSGIMAGTYFLQFTAAGRTPYFSGLMRLAAGQVYDAGMVVLHPAGKQLQEFKVKGSRPVIQVKPDRIVFNVSTSISATGNNGLELLQKLPGIQMDEKGKIVLKGKLGVRIYVDGRITQLSGEDLAAWLKSITSNDVETIEIITAPGAKYDASGNAGVVNIRLRKNASLGWNGSVSAGYNQGLTPKGNGAAGINYRNIHLNAFANASANLGQYKMDIRSPRILKDNAFDQRLVIINDMRNFNAKAGMDYFISSRKTIGVIATGGISHDDWLSNSQTDIYERRSSDYTKTLIALNNTPRKRTNFNTNVNYRYADSTGRELNADIDYGAFKGRANAYQPNYYRYFDTPVSAVITSNNMPTDIDIYSARADATFPTGKGKLGAGVKSAFVTTRNHSDLYMLKDNTMEPVSDRSFGFSYSENVNAAYLSYQRPLGKKWAVQAGIRAEQTNSRGMLSRADGKPQPDNNSKRSYLDFFPNAVMTYTPNEENTINLSYGRRVDRPIYQDLNPFELKVDELIYQKGNAFLQPQYTNNFELSHTLNKWLTSSAAYAHVRNFSAEITDTISNTTVHQQRNIARQRILSLSISATLDPTRFWKFSGSALGNYQDFQGATPTGNIDAQAYSFGVSVQNNFTIGKGFSAEVTGWLNGPGLYGPIFKTKTMGALDLGVQKAVISEKGTIRLGVSDVLGTGRYWRARNDFNGLSMNIHAINETRMLRLSFSYNFGSRGILASRQRETGQEAERGRIKVR